MSPMTASIMSAVPARRAGAGSAMNDATRELGAALGIAVLGSVAASRYDSQVAPFLHGLSATQHSTADTSIAGALRVAGKLPHARVRCARPRGRSRAFVSGMHLAALSGAVLALIAAVFVYRYLPHSLVPEGAMHGPRESLEEAAEIGIAGALPAFSDMVVAGDRVAGEHSAQPT